MSDLDLPPPFRLVTLREVGDAFAHAQKIAAAEGAGTLVFVGRFDLAEFAVVLEPDQPLRVARRAIYAAMNALYDALLVHAPPEKTIAFNWPDAIRVDGGLVGGGRLAWPDGADEDAPPEWLVFGAMIRTVSMSDAPGLRPLETALDEEGFMEFGAGRLAESFSRHLMVAFDCLEQDGFAAVAKNYLMRLSPEKGARRDITENGDLVVCWTASNQTDRHALGSALAEPSWYDPQKRGPR